MGGPGAGHKSERARQARLANMARARAARKREPLRWRSRLESRIIEQLVWQWWRESRGQWLVTSGWKNEMQIPRRLPRQAPRNAGNPAVRENGAPGREAKADLSAPSPTKNVGAGFGMTARNANREIGAPRQWSRLRVAQFLGVSHTWVNKLVKRFEADPDRMRRRMAAFAPATLEKLERAREETRRQREFGWLRGPIRRRRVKWMLGGKTQRAIVWTHSERRRREEAQRGQQCPPSVPYAELPPWARGVVLAGDAGMKPGRRRW